ncbi:MAG: DUF1273 domain-containing protein [Defluviitaleaceae bacterium]|nr:DUF1273 domain-containing protein [Defluviitaleaceae bacterium]
MLISNKENTCCFTGHRALSKKKIERIVKRLNEEIDLLIQQGVTNYISGGAVGFDQIAASLVLSRKQQGVDIRLIFALPCHNQDEKWNDRQKQLYRSLLSEADEVHYVSEKFTDECMKERNYFMVDNSAYCICALTNPISGTGQTTRYAQQQDLQVINVAK